MGRSEREKKGLWCSVGSEVRKVEKSAPARARAKVSRIEVRRAFSASATFFGKRRKRMRGKKGERKANTGILVSFLKIRFESAKSKIVVHFYKNSKLRDFFFSKLALIEM